jgi:chemotaxis protein histidine kinase CheA
MTQDRHAKIQDFVNELSGFAKTAESTLAEVEKDLEANRPMLQGFAGMMLTIRGTAQQLGFGDVAHIASLGEEIAIKGAGAESRPQVRKCVGSLWDVITSVKYLIEHHDRETGEEQQILIHRLEYTLKAFGGSRDKVGQDDIEKLLKERG